MLDRKSKRLAALSEALSEHRVLHLNDAAKMLDVSLMTVRRDIADNPEIFAYLGGHIVPAASIEGDGPYDVAKAKDNHAASKKAACVHAARHIQPDETVFFDCGTTLLHLIDLIPDTFQITAICYALNIAEKLTKLPNVRMIMLGGIYHPSSESFASAADKNAFENFGVNTAFLTAAGLDLERGASCENFHEAQVKRQAMSAGQKSILVTDKSKLGKVKPAFFSPTDMFQSIVTEDGELEFARQETEAIE
ncbi:MAG: DeoR/GlpR family DNA-binding transcription regulator [Hyphomicrobiales bacterium]